MSGTTVYADLSRAQSVSMSLFSFFSLSRLLAVQRKSLCAQNAAKINQQIKEGKFPQIVSRAVVFHMMDFWLKTPGRRNVVIRLH